MGDKNARRASLTEAIHGIAEMEVRVTYKWLILIFIVWMSVLEIDFEFGFISGERATGALYAACATMFMLLVIDYKNQLNQIRAQGKNDKNPGIISRIIGDGKDGN